VASEASRRTRFYGIGLYSFRVAYWVLGLTVRVWTLQIQAQISDKRVVGRSALARVEASRSANIATGNGSRVHSWM
jgi:hypothetical protein